MGCCNVKCFSIARQLYLYGAASNLHYYSSANFQCYTIDDNAVNDNGVRRYFYDSANIQRCEIKDTIVHYLGSQVYDRSYCFYDRSYCFYDTYRRPFRTNSDILQVRYGTEYNDIPCTVDYKFRGLVHFNPFCHLQCFAWKCHHSDE